MQLYAKPPRRQDGPADSGKIPARVRASARKCRRRSVRTKPKLRGREAWAARRSYCAAAKAIDVPSRDGLRTQAVDASLGPIDPTLWPRLRHSKKRIHPRDKGFPLAGGNPSKRHQDPLLKMISGERTALHRGDFHRGSPGDAPSGGQPFKGYATHVGNTQQVRNGR